jgi:putative membrane protein
MNKDLILRENLAIQRTIMANQTTFLSFVRTSMYFLVAGLSVQNIVQLAHVDWAFYLLYGISALLMLLGTLNYFRQKRLIQEARKMVGNAAQAYVL